MKKNNLAIAVVTLGLWMFFFTGNTRINLEIKTKPGGPLITIVNGGGKVCQWAEQKCTSDLSKIALPPEQRCSKPRGS